MRRASYLANRWWEWLLLLAAFSYGLYTLPLSLMGPDWTYIPGGPGDGALNNYLLEHGFRWLTGRQEDFWNAPFFFPAPAVITYSDNHLGTLPLYATFRLLGLDRESAYQAWFILLFGLNYGCCAWALRRLSFHTAGAAAGAFLFAFGLPMVAQLDHSQLLPRFLVPLAFYFTSRFIEHPDRRNLAGMLISVVWQLYCTIYIGMFLLGLLSTFGAAYVLVSSRAAISRCLRSVLRDPVSLGIVLAASLSLLWLMRPYYDTSREYGYREWSQIASMLPRWQSYLLPVGHSLAWSWLSRMRFDLPMAWEHQMFVGIVPWVCALISVSYVFRSTEQGNPHRRLVAAVLSTLIVTMMLTLSIDGWTLYEPYALLPGVGAIRAVTRIILVLLFPFAICVAFALTRLSTHEPLTRPARLAVMGLIVCSSMLDQTVWGAKQVRYSKRDIQERVDLLKRKVGDQPSDPPAFAYMPARSDGDEFAPHIVAMLASQDLGIPTVNGYSGSLPRSFEFYRHYDQLWALEQWIAFAREKYRSDRGAEEALSRIVIIGTPQGDIGGHSLSIAFTPLSQAGYRAELSTVENQITMKPLENREVAVMVRNKSDENWPALGDFDGNNKLGLSHRWLSAEGEQLTGFVARISLQYDIPPGGASELATTLTAPDAAGHYLVEFDLVQEHVAWFRDEGSSAHKLPVTVVNQMR